MRNFEVHLQAGDTPAYLAERLLSMSKMTVRIAHVARLATALHQQICGMSLDELKINGSANGSPRMNIRHIHNYLVYPARRTHCHAALYRSDGAAALLTTGGFTKKGNAVIHCEHTVPTGTILEQLKYLQTSGELRNPAAVLDWVFQFGIVTAVLQTERMKGHPTVELDKRREFSGTSSSWRSRHPDMLQGVVVSGANRPFLRYKGTGLQVQFALTGEPIDPESYTFSDHQMRISNVEIYNTLSYFDR